MAKDRSWILGISRLGRNPSSAVGKEAAGVVNSEPPITPTEIKLAETWQSVLPPGQIQRGDNFIALGGDSLGLAQVITEINETYQISLPIEVIANNLTLQGMAAAIDRLAPLDRDRS